MAENAEQHGSHKLQELQAHAGNVNCVHIGVLPSIKGRPGVMASLTSRSSHACRASL
jgi:hypothetical protein